MPPASLRPPSATLEKKMLTAGNKMLAPLGATSLQLSQEAGEHLLRPQPPLGSVLARGIPLVCEAELTPISLFRTGGNELPCFRAIHQPPTALGFQRHFTLPFLLSASQPPTRDRRCQAHSPSNRKEAGSGSWRPHKTETCMSHEVRQASVPPSPVRIFVPAVVRFTWSWATERNLARTTVRVAGSCWRGCWEAQLWHMTSDTRLHSCDSVSPLIRVVRHVLPGAETGITEHG